MPTDSRNPVASLVPGLFVLIWSTGFIVARLVAPHAEPLTFLSLRFVGSAGALALMALLARAPWPRTWRGWRDGLVAGILIQGIYLDAVFFAVHEGLPAGIAALVASLQPLLTALVAGPVLKERVSPRRWAGIGLGFVGAALVLLPKLGHAGADGLPPVALGVCFLGMVAITAGTLWQKSTGGGLDLRSNAAIQFIGAALVTVPIALLTEHGGFDATLPAWGGLAWAILVLSVGGTLILMALIRRGAVTGVAALFYLVPAVSAAMAFILFGETLGAIQLVGMAVTIAGVALAGRG